MSYCLHLRLFSVAAIVLLTACSQPGKLTSAGSLPQQSVAVGDPQSRCPTLIENMTTDQQNDPRYWLQLLACVQQQPADDNYRLAGQGTADNWAQIFRRDILLSGADITDQQRQKMLEDIPAWRPQVAAGVRPLLQLWQDKLENQLNASGNEQKYQQLRQTSDNEIATLRLQQQQLQQELSDKRQQLQRLTDIERQLSSRKTTDLPETPRSRLTAPETGGQEKEAN